MRTSALCAGVGALAFALLLITPGIAGGPDAHTAPATPLALSHAQPAASPGPAVPHRPFGPWLNATWASPAAGPATSPPPISALAVTAPPRPPPTTPVVMTFLTASQTCCVQANFTAPAGGPWAMVVLNYTGQAVGGVYDSSFRAYIDQVQVLFGTTPEYGIWFVSRDVTPYESLLNGTFNFTFLLSAATVGGYFLSSVSLSFYPPVPGAPIPRVPDQVIPLFHRVFVSTSTPIVTATATVPTNVVNATLELWTYGFGPDEFWYATQSPYRALYVDVGGQPLVAQLPFPYINTGGSDLFAWRPITAAFTLDDRPYDFDVTGALGMLEGSHNYSANLSGVTSGSNWLIGGALLLYTSPTASAATLTTYRFSDPAPRLVTDHSTYFDQFDNLSYSYASDIPGASGISHASISTNESFASWLHVDSTGSWNNLTALESLSSSGLLRAPGTSVWTNRTILYPLAMDLGQSFVVTSTTGGGYPIYGNFTSYFLNAIQEWNELTVATTLTNGTGVLLGVARIDNRVTGGVNIFAGTEELTGPNAALLLSITFVQSSTTDVFSESTAAGPSYFAYQHTLVGTAYQPPGPNNVETVVTNSIASPLSAQLSASSPSLEQGQSLRLEATVLGGQGALTYTYAGLPVGCASANTPVLDCTPTLPGSYLVSVVGTDASGARSLPAVVSVTVLGPPTVELSTNASIVDVGGNAYASVTVVGGIAPFTCVWYVDGTATARQGCTQTFSTSPSTVGTTNVSVVASDAAGGSSAAGWVLFHVVPHAVVSFTSSAGTTLDAGSSTLITAVVSGGVPPFGFLWYLNGTAVANVSGATFLLANLAPGVYEVSAKLTDEAGIATFEQGPTITVLAPPIAVPAAGAAPTPWTLYFGVGVVVGVAAGAIGGFLTTRAALRPRLRAARAPPEPPSRAR